MRIPVLDIVHELKYSAAKCFNLVWQCCDVMLIVIILMHNFKSHPSHVYVYCTWLALMCVCLSLCTNTSDFSACSHARCFVFGKYCILCCSAGWRMPLLMLNTRPFKCEVMHEADVVVCTLRASCEAPTIYPTVSKSQAFYIFPTLYLCKNTARAFLTLNFT